MANTKDNGIVLAGQPYSPIGLGEHIRCSFRSFTAAGLPAKIYDIYSFPYQRDPGIESELAGNFAGQLSSRINIFHINGDEVKPVIDHLGQRLTTGAYNIIYPFWELAIYPPEWAETFVLFQEIWAPSRFIYDSIRKSVIQPVTYLPMATEVTLGSFLSRRYFGLPEDAYIFLFFFDLRSYIERKNPTAIFQAFELVRKANLKRNTYLVIKINRQYTPADNRILKEFTDSISKFNCTDKCIIIDKIYSDNEIKNLVRCCECFISLHRSEGYGRGLAEAMFLGKPVIGTGYSGNLDFMHKDNSLLIDYKLIPVREGEYPYAIGQEWADPDIGQAADYMIKLASDPAWGYNLGRTASRYMRIHFSYRACGLRYTNRIDEIKNYDLENSRALNKIATIKPRYSHLSDNIQNRTKIKYFSDKPGYFRYINSFNLEKRRTHEKMISSAETWPGYCAYCRRNSEFRVSSDLYLGGNVHLREGMVCKSCGLNNRHRLLYKALQDFYGGPENLISQRIYLAERVTILYRRLTERIPGVTGSEYFGSGHASGEMGRLDGSEIEIMHQDLCNTSFSDTCFDAVVHADVLEHVAFHRKALKEIYRILKPGGVTLFTAPFLQHQFNNVIRAYLGETNEIIYPLPAVYHGNPVDSKGALAFQTFGWELLDDMRSAGFKRAKIGCLIDVNQGFTSSNGPNEECYMEPVVFYARK